jgi:tetratricopeptide (TPR) repeat protein
VKYLICISLLTLCRAETSDAPKVWSDWVLEGKALATAGKYSDAAQAFHRALALADDSKASSRTLVGIHDALASVFAEAGRYAEAEHEYRRALDILEKSRGRQSLDYALLITGLAVLPTQWGNRESFIATLREAIVANSRTGAVRELALVRACLAQIFMDERSFANAELVLLEARADFPRLRSEDPKLLAELMNALGVLRFNQARYQESIELYQESLRLFKDVVGNERSALIALSNLASSYLKLGRLDEAEPIFQRAIALCTKTLGGDHPTCGTVLENYAVVLRKLGRKREAKTLAARAQQIARASRRHNGMDSTVSVMALRSDRN